MAGIDVVQEWTAPWPAWRGTYKRKDVHKPLLQDRTVLPYVLRSPGSSLLLQSGRETQGERKQRSCQRCCQHLLSHRTTIYPTTLKAGRMTLLLSYATREMAAVVNF